MIDAFAKDGFDVFAGNEKPLLDNIKSGGAGCISATANVNPGQIAETYATTRRRRARSCRAGSTTCAASCRAMS